MKKVQIVEYAYKIDENLFATKPKNESVLIASKAVYYDYFTAIRTHEYFNKQGVVIQRIKEGIFVIEK